MIHRNRDAFSAHVPGARRQREHELARLPIDRPMRSLAFEAALIGFVLVGAVLAMLVLLS